MGAASGVALMVVGGAAILVGAVFVAGGIAKLGFVTDLLSKPIRLGYLAGIALTVIMTQLPKLFGFSGGGDTFRDAVPAFFGHLDETNGVALAVGATSLAVILVLTHDSNDCNGFWECVFRELFFWFFVIVFGLFLMWVGATLGSGIALRIRRFRGHKLTATFLAILMVPWTILMLATVFRLLDNHLVVAAALSPILLVAVPAVLARGSVLLIRTHHL